jgi:hypothetical protein
MPRISNGSHTPFCHRQSEACDGADRRRLPYHGPKPTLAGAAFAAEGQLWSWRVSVTVERLNRNRGDRQPTSAERNLPEISSGRSSGQTRGFSKAAHWPKNLN